MLSSFDYAVAYLDDIIMKSKSIIKRKEPVHKVFLLRFKIMVLNLKRPNMIFSWKKSNTWVTLLIRKVEVPILNELLQLKTC